MDEIKGFSQKRRTRRVSGCIPTSLKKTRTSFPRCDIYFPPWNSYNSHNFRITSTSPRRGIKRRRERSGAAFAFWLATSPSSNFVFFSRRPPTTTTLSEPHFWWGSVHTVLVATIFIVLSFDDRQQRKGQFCCMQVAVRVNEWRCKGLTLFGLWNLKPPHVFGVDIYFTLHSCATDVNRKIIYATFKKNQTWK